MRFNLWVMNAVNAVYYPQEGHGFMKREGQIDEITRMVGWFDKYLKGTH